MSKSPTTTKSSCTFYPHCKKGKSCPYQHPTPSTSAEASPKATNLCPRFVSGTCTYGSKCKRSHTLQKHNSRKGKAGTGTVKVRQKEIKSSNNAAGGDWGNEGVIEVVNTSAGINVSLSPNSMKPLCYFYPSDCDGGADCEFRHEGLDDSRQHSTTELSGAPSAASDVPDDEADEQHQWEENEGSPQDHLHAEIRPIFKPDEIVQLPAGGISKSLSNNIPSALSNDNQTQTLSLPVTSSRSPLNHIREPVTMAQYPHISQIKLHWSQFADPYANSQVPFCKLHARNECNIGVSCPFRHSLAISEYVALFQDQQPTLVTLRTEGDSTSLMNPPTTQPIFCQTLAPAPIMAPPVRIPTAPIAEERDVQLPPPSSFALECNFYQIGNCRNGDRCPYAHTKHPLPELSIPSNHGGNLKASALFPTDYPRKPCRYFMTKNFCPKGEHCKFLHENTSEPQWFTPIAEADENNARSRENMDDSPWEGGWQEKGGSNKTEGPLAETKGDLEDAEHSRCAGDWQEEDSRKATEPDETKGVEEHNCWDGSWEEKNSQNGTEGPVPDENQGGWEDTDHSRWAGSWQGDTSDTTKGPAPVETKGDWDNERDNSAWYAPSNNSNGKEGLLDRRVPGERRFPCNMYERKGYCRYADSCKFAHNDPSTPGHGGNDQSGVEGFPPKNGTSSTTVEERPSAPESRLQDDTSILDSAFDETQNSESAAELGVEINQESRAADDGWAQEWSQDTDRSNVPPAKAEAYCKEFGQGIRCKWGDDCLFKHGDPNGTISLSTNEVEQVVGLPVHHEESGPTANNVDEAEVVPSKAEESEIGQSEEPIVFDHPEVRRLMLGSTTTFGPDCTPESVATLAESSTLLLSNLSSDTSIDGARLLLDSFGGVPREDSLRVTEYSASIAADFPDEKKARFALEALHRQTPGLRMIVASLKASVEPRFRVPDERPTLKVSWNKPSLTGWSHYPTIRKAKEEAERLNGVVLKGRAIRVEVCVHDKRQKENFAIAFSNLLPDTNKQDIEALCDGHIVVTLREGPTYKANPTDKIKEEIRSFGQHEFDRIPDVEQSTTSTAFATFASEEIALEVIDKLRSCPLQYLGDQVLDIKQVYFSRYRVKHQVFNLVKHEIDRLQERDGSTLQYNVNYDAYHIRLSVSSKKQTFMGLNGELCSLLGGEIVQFEGGILWDDYFETSSCEKALQQLKTDAIIPDKVGRCIRIFGSKEDRVTAKAELLRLFSKLRKAHSEFDIPRVAIRPLVTGQFQDLQKTGQGKYSFDVLRSKIIVGGTANDLSKVKVYVESLELSPVTYQCGFCEICHRKPNEPIRLSCRHSYCKTCLQMAVTFAKHAPLQCIANLQLDGGSTEPCTAYVPYKIIHDVLSTREIDRLLRSSLLIHIRNNDELFTCPSIGCETILPTGPPGWNLLCSRCRAEICSFCKTLGHIGISCVDIKDM